MTNPLFISYRRSDTTGEAGRLADSLENLLGARCVFRDTDDIQPGEDFERVLTRELAGTHAVLVLIGKRWLAELTARQHQPAPDFVRIEIATALRLGKTLIPVLLQGAELPGADALPEDLRPLLAHQAVSLREEAWAMDCGRLADAIGRPYAWRPVALRALVALPAALIAAKYAIGALAPDAINQLALARGLVLALLAGYFSIEIALWWRQRRKKA